MTSIYFCAYKFKNISTKVKKEILDNRYKNIYNYVVIVKSEVKDFNAKLKEIAEQNSGIISTKTAEENGVSRAVLSLMAESGKIERYSKGFYFFPEETIPDEIYILSLCSPNIIFSHETALFLNGISERTPFFHSFTMPQNKRLSSEISKGCRIHHIKNDFWELGKSSVKTTFGNFVPCYDMERTICDVIRDKNKLDPETYIASLKLYSLAKNKDLAKLGSYATKMGLAKKVRGAMEVLL